MSIDFIDTTARFAYLTPEEVAEHDHPAVPTARGRAGLALGDSVLILGAPDELRSWLHAALPAALDVVPGPALDTAGSASRQHYIDTGTYLPTMGPWWICIDRQHHPDVAVGPYDEEYPALRDLEGGDVVDALCEQDCLDAYLTRQPESDRVLLRPDGTPHATPEHQVAPRPQAYALAARGHDGRAVVIAQVEHHDLADGDDDDDDERTTLPQHSNDLGDWCPYSATTVAADAGCPQGCAAAPDNR